MGGGTMRAVAKAAALGGYRAPGLFSGQAAASAAKRAPLNTSAAVPPSTEGVLAVSLSASNSKAPVPDAAAAPLQRPVWDVDDWDFSDWPEEGRELVVNALQPAAPRLVFGPVPTLEEAKEATCDLKDALEKVYFSGTVATTSGGQALTFVPTVPKHVAQTFSLLKESPEAQEVVASLASDKNVWDAVMKNPKVMEFYRDQRYVNEDPVASDDTNGRSWRPCESPTTSTAESSKTVGASPPSGFAGFWLDVKVHMMYTMAKVEEMVQNTKVKVEEMFTTTKVKVEKMVSNISSFFESLLGTSTETSGGVEHAKAGFLVLAIAVIMVILVKRG